MGHAQRHADLVGGGGSLSISTATEEVDGRSSPEGESGGAEGVHCGELTLEVVVSGFGGCDEVLCTTPVPKVACAKPLGVCGYESQHHSYHTSGPFTMGISAIVWMGICLCI